MTMDSPQGIDGSYTPAYHDKVAAYVLPNDAPEHVRLEYQCRLLRDVYASHGQQSEFHAPLPASVNNLLDVGCGTGVCSDAAAARFPQAHVYGVDLSPVPGGIREKRPNIQYLVADILKGPDALNAGGAPGIGEYDFVFSRLLALGMSDWRSYLKIGHDLLRTGGWMEVHDFNFIVLDASGKVISDESSAPGEEFEWLRLLRIEASKTGLDFESGFNAQSLMRNAGFVAIQTWRYDWWFGPKHASNPAEEKLGQYVLTWMLPFFHHVINRVMTGKMSEGEISEVQRKCKESLRQREARFVYAVSVGRKA
ncbi:uncharacterized protein HMPREF1541_00961 [Cyphellophora europaea CBS 101466]|uniref:Methyltransferase domain-containing protein n=1 Tax=Cyphellophora europaea (strain CBS 101466) TaxID=1220924 RepID=W2SDK0_CYPE1|nr:uncharacterized protein HMPREF1541_00961 [Cyphellophora europaea CBS 101466]ETN46772.1 hypothetical protein HMPREF1541_00961 [Cyphellophora europaea CBS 101466]